MNSLFAKSALTLLLFTTVIGTSRADTAAPSDKPPQMIDLNEEESAPTVTQHKKESTEQTVQTIQNGPQTEVRVTNEVGTYIVKPNQTVGTSVPGDAQSSSNHAVQWVVKKWGGPKGTEPSATPPTLPENPDSPTNN